MDLTKDNKLVESFHVRDARYLKNRYLVMDLVDGDGRITNKVEVLDTVLIKKLTDKLNEKAIQEKAIQFMCGAEDIPRAIILSHNQSLSYAIINTKTFEIINNTFVGIKIRDILAVHKGFYKFEGLLADDTATWKNIVMNRYTGEIVESIKSGTNLG